MKSAKAGMPNVDAISSLSDFLSEPDELTRDDIQGIQALLVDGIANMRLNRMLPHLKGMDDATRAFLKTLSYRTRHLAQITPDIDSIYSKFKHVQTLGMPLDNEDKISLQQYGIMHDLAKIHDLLSPLHEKNLLTSNAILSTLYTQSSQAAEMIHFFEAQFNQELKVHAGTVMFEDMSKEVQMFQSMNTFYDRLNYFFTKLYTKYDHASKLVTTDANENRLSHLYTTGYKEDGCALRDFLYNDTYRLKLDSLIDKQTQQLLEMHLGAEWLGALEHEYSAIERTLHDEARHPYTFANAKIGMLKKLNIAVEAVFLGHKSVLRQHDNTLIHQQIFQTDPRSLAEEQHKPLLCSEFIGLTMIAAIEELNQRIKDVLIHQGAKNIPDKIIKNPISRREKLYLLTPERLLTALKKRAVVERYELPPTLSQHITTTQKAKKVLAALKSENITTGPPTPRTNWRLN